MMDNMKTTTRPNGSARADQDELRPHYDFDYSTAKPNRFAERLSKVEPQRSQENAQAAVS